MGFKDGIIAAAKKLWDIIKKIFRKLIKLAGILVDFAALAGGIIFPQAKMIFGLIKITIKLIKVAVKVGKDVIECICEPDGKIVDYENGFQIIQGEEIDTETAVKFRNGNDLIVQA